MNQIIPRISAIGTAVPDQDIHAAFISWASAQLPDRRERALFDRMAKRSGIAQRWSVLPLADAGGSPVDPGGFYADEILPSTARRMLLYAQHAPDLALRAIAALGQQADIKGLTHLVVASCTGFVAPGVDQIIADRLGLPESTERVLIGFMGCYAAVTALRTARHIVRSEPASRVLVVTVELSTLHLQPVHEIEPLLAMLHFGDGAAAALVCADDAGLTLDQGISMTLPASQDLIRWAIGDTGFAMHLSGEVPGRIEAALRLAETRFVLTQDRPVSSWAIHAGGRTILDAAERGLSLDPQALNESRATLRDCGNMSSATLMFTLGKIIKGKPEHGVALAFGPGLAAEGLRFGWSV